MKLIKYLVACTFTLSNVVFGLVPENEVESFVSTKQESKSIPMPAKKVSQGNREFAFEFYKAASEKEQNLAISPFSLSSCMGMIGMIADGSTLEQIQEVMHFPKYPLVLDFGFRWINESLTSGMAIGSEPVHLTPTNMIWTQKGVIISPQILTKVVHFWDGIQEADFENDPLGSQEEINGYVEEKTNGKIKEFVPDGVIDTKTRMVAVNTLYFSAPWKKPFPEYNTQDAIFKGLKNDQLIPFMQKQERLNIGEFNPFTMVEIPFTESLSTDSVLSLYIVLPNEGTDLVDLEEQFNSRTFRRAAKNLEEKYVNLRFPKIRMETKVSLKPPLMKMGLTLPFIPEGGFPFADVEGGKLVLTDVIQAVTVDFNEWGSTCAAATGGFIGLTSIPTVEEMTDVTCDRPFIFVLADKNTQTILFMGKFVQPN